MKKIRKGWHCEISSWENDADYRRTEELLLQDKQSVIELHHIFSTFCKAGCNFRLEDGSPCYGNGRNDDYDKLFDLVCNVITTDELKRIFENKDSLVDFLYDTIGFSENFDGLRVFDSMMAFYVPEDINFEILDLFKR